MAYIGKQPVVGNFQVCDAISVVNGQAAYTMQVNSTNVEPENANHMLVSLNGILQKPGSSFTISGSTITFASNLATGDVIDFIILLGDVLNIGTPSDNGVVTASIAANAVTGAKLNTDVISAQTALGETPADTDELLVSDAGVLKRVDFSHIKGGGKVLQVQNFLLNHSSSETTSSTSFQDSSLTDQITPSATDSKILVMVHLNGNRTQNGNADCIVTVKRTVGGTSTDIGGTQTNRLAHTNVNVPQMTAFNVFDSPNTTSAVDYTVQFRSTDSSRTVEVFHDTGASTITLMEIGA